MSAEITYINGTIPVDEALEKIVAGLRDGEIEGDFATVVIGERVWCLGMGEDSDRGMRAVFDLNYALHRVMRATHGDYD